MTARRRTPRLLPVVLVSACSVPLLATTGFLWLAGLPIAIVLLGSLWGPELRPARIPAALLAIAYAVPYAIWKLRPDPAASLSKDVAPGFVVAIALVALAVVVVLVVVLRRRRAAG